MTKTNFGKIKNGVEASLYEIGNSNGMKVALTDFGATVVSIWVKDKEGKMVDVVTGYDTAALNTSLKQMTTRTTSIAEAMESQRKYGK